jgi:hypothetical protein
VLNSRAQVFTGFIIFSLLLVMLVESNCTSLPPTPPTAAVIETGAVENITATSAILMATLKLVDPEEGAALSFEWGKTKELGAITQASKPYYKAGDYSFELTSLAPGTTLWVRARAEGKAVTYGKLVEFKTLALPKVETLPAQEVGISTARLSTRIPSVGAAKAIQQYFEYGIGDLSQKSRISQITQAGTVSAQLTGLEAGKTYQYRSVIESGDPGRVEGSIMTFTTKKALTVSQIQVRDITATSASLAASIEDLSDAKSATVCFEYSEDKSFRNSTQKQTLTAPGQFTDNISNLAIGYTLNCRVKVETSGYGSFTGVESSFRTTNAKELFPVQEGHGIKYQVNDSGEDLDSIVWAVSQHNVKGKHGQDFYFTIISEVDKRRRTFTPNSLGGRFDTRSSDRNPGSTLVRFFGGFPSSNHGNLLFLVCSTEGIKVGDKWEETNATYRFEKAGAYTVAGREYKDTVEFSYVTSESSPAYTNGEGHFVLAKEVGLIELYFKRKTGGQVIFSGLDSKEFSQREISGTITSNTMLLENLSVQLANGDLGNRSKVDGSGNFAIQCYGPDMVLRIGFDKNNDGAFDSVYFRPVEYKVKGITQDVNDIYLRLN